MKNNLKNRLRDTIVNFLRFLTQRLRSFGGAFVSIFLILYFSYHLLQGDHGIFAWGRLEKKLKIAEQECQEITKVHDTLAHRVRLLRPESLDPDMLEERAQQVLNFSCPSDVIVLIKDLPAPHSIK